MGMQDRDNPPIDNGFFAISKNQAAAVKKAFVWSLVCGLITLAYSKDIGDAALVVCAIMLYAICHLLQSIHGLLKNLHARLDDGYPPAQ